VCVCVCVCVCECVCVCLCVCACDCPSTVGCNTQKPFSPVALLRRWGKRVVLKDPSLAAPWVKEVSKVCEWDVPYAYV
jgi:hypothetical protein